MSLRAQERVGRSGRRGMDVAVPWAVETGSQVLVGAAVNLGLLPPAPLRPR